MRTGQLSEIEELKPATRPLVSIVVPVYNTPEKPLRRCMASLLGQDYENIEVITVDDGSDGPCLSVLKDIAAHDGRLRLISGGHKGVSHARNVGMEASEGDWIAFSDADDEVVPSFISDAVRIAVSEQADLVCGSVVSLFQGEKPKAEPKDAAYFVVDEIRGLTSAKMQMLGHVKYKCFTGPNYRGRGPVAKLYRKATIDSLRYEEGIAIGEDTLFNYRYIERCSAIVIVDAIWYWYYQYHGSAVHSVSIDPWLSSISGILASCAPDEDRRAFVSRCAFMTGQGIESLLSANGAFGGHHEGVSLLKFAGEQGCFSAECYKGYELSPWLKIYDWLCKRGWYNCAYSFWVVKKLAKDLLKNNELIDGNV